MLTGDDVRKSLEKMLQTGQKTEGDSLDTNFINSTRRAHNAAASKTSETIEPVEKKQSLLATRVLERVLASASSTHKSKEALVDTSRSVSHNQMKNIEHTPQPIKKNPSQI